MKLIGAGFGRTGTMSIKAALEQIDHGPCFHMIDLIKGEMALPPWEAAASGEDVDFEAVLEGWESTIDWPACSYWPKLVDVFPDSKVLLTVRDPDAWYDSCLHSIHEASERGQRGELGGDHPPPAEVMAVINDMIWNGDFKGRFQEDREFAIDVFNRHNDEVKAGVDPDRLLVYEVKQGWGPLCEFLGEEEPEGPFPHLNDTASFRGMFGMPALS